VVDLYWFLRHLYKMDLEMSSHKKKASQQEVGESASGVSSGIHRRTYKKMLRYFE
jgi:predicted metal-dependent hydrolase